MFGPFGLSKTALEKSRSVLSLQTGFVYDYTVWFLLVLLLFFFFLDFSSNVLVMMDAPLYFIFFITLFFSIKD